MVAPMYGLGYGIGQMGAQVIPGIQSGQQLSLQQQRERTENELQGLRLKNEKMETGANEEENRVMSEELPDELANPSSFMTPSQYRASLENHYADKLAKAGFGKRASMHRDLSEKHLEQHLNQVGELGIKSILAGNFDEGAKYLNAITQGTHDPIQSVEPLTDENGNLGGYAVKTKNNPDGFKIQPEYLQYLAAQKGQLANNMARMYGMDKKLYTQKEIQAMRDRAAMERKKTGIEARHKDIETQQAHADLRARISAGARVGAVAQQATNKATIAKMRAHALMEANPELTPQEAMDSATREVINAKDVDATGVMAANDVLKIGFFKDPITGEKKIVPGMETAVSNAQDFLKGVTSRKPKPTSRPQVKQPQAQKLMTSADIEATAKSSGRSRSEVIAAAKAAGYTIKE